VNIKALICAAGIVCLSAPTQLLAAPSADELQKMFEQAMQTRESGKTFEAIKLFETILNSHPTLNRVRLELAVAYNQAARYEDAMRQFKMVLDDPSTPENVKLSILAYLGQLNSDELKPDSHHNISYYVNLGAFQNSNINATPGAGLSPITGISTAAKISSFGVHADVSASDRFRLKAPIDVMGSAAYFEWQTQIGLSSTHYSKTSDYDYHVISVASGPALSAPGHWRSNLSLRVDQLLLGGAQLATFASVNPNIAFDLGHYRNLTFEGTYTRRNYDQIPDYGRDSTEAMLGSGYSTLVNHQHLGLEGGFRLRQNQASNAGYSYDDTELYFSSFAVLSEQTAVYLRLNHHHYSYVGIDPTTLIKRDETESLYAIGYNRDLHDGILKSWTFNLEFSADRNTSNVGVYEFHRNLISANLSRYFQ
jgi:tetratricopeptide (TPR) repeat protein